MSSPTVRTMALLRKNGYLAGIVEKRNWFAGPPGLVCPACRKNKVGKTVDLFGWCDIIAVPSATTDLRGDGVGDMRKLASGLWITGTFYVQTTSKSNHSSRRRKIVESEEARRVLHAGQPHLDHHMGPAGRLRGPLASHRRRNDPGVDRGDAARQAAEARPGRGGRVTTMLITAVVPWFGGKRTMAQIIVDVIGKHKAYWEPFCGSMAVLMAKPAVASETVNDLHSDLINLSWVIQDAEAMTNFPKWVNEP
jgi:hypothetical protein